MREWNSHGYVFLVVLGFYLDGSGSTETQVEGSLGPGAEDVREIAPYAVLSEDP